MEDQDIKSVKEKIENLYTNQETISTLVNSVAEAAAITMAAYEVKINQLQSLCALKDQMIQRLEREIISLRTRIPNSYQ